ncbi:hypothetical protein OIO90_001781 [Microbotryomycetes sp. JL221]|nr:hypothetical protein OIO90_001781 [Microbotryomycetes sp. JL221]
MAKKARAVSAPTPSTQVPQHDVFQRLSYMYQVSVLLNNTVHERERSAKRRRFNPNKTAVRQEGDEAAAQSTLIATQPIGDWNSRCSNSSSKRSAQTPDESYEPEITILEEDSLVNRATLVSNSTIEPNTNERAAPLKHTSPAGPALSRNLIKAMKSISKKVTLRIPFVQEMDHIDML